MNGSGDLCRYIFGFLKAPRRPAVDGWAHATYINGRCRSILINWLMDVTQSFKMPEPVLHYTVQLIDAFVARRPSLPRGQLQLLGVSALLLADKVVNRGEADISPAMLAGLTAYAHTPAEVIEFEMHLFPIFDEVFQGWGAFHFLVHFAAEIQLPKKWFHLAQMYLESSLLSIALSRHTPGLLGASACALAVRSGIKLHEPAPVPCGSRWRCWRSSVGEARRQSRVSRRRSGSTTAAM